MGESVRPEAEVCMDLSLWVWAAFLGGVLFMLASVVHRFVYLKAGLSVILLFIGAKMLLLDVYKIPTAVSLNVVANILTLSIVASLIETSRTRPSGPLKPSGR